MNVNQTYDGRYCCGKCGKFYLNPQKAEECCKERK